MSYTRRGFDGALLPVLALFGRGVIPD